MGQRLTIVVDPMLAAGHTAVAALDRLKKDGAREISFVCLVAAPEGIAELRRTHPDVPIFAAAVDEKLNDKGYIVPGLGDAGDRIRSEEHTSELQSLMRISYAVFCLKKKNKHKQTN